MQILEGTMCYVSFTLYKVRKHDHTLYIIHFPSTKNKIKYQILNKNPKFAAQKK